jgi:hypothetical protein
MMPQLGVLSTVHRKASAEVFDRDCLIRLGTCIAPVGPRPQENNKNGDIVTVDVTFSDGSEETLTAKYGEIKKVDLPVGETAQVQIDPARRYDVGEGKGREVETEVEGGVVGLILDARGRRPLYLPEDPGKRGELLMSWIKSMDVYPIDVLEKYRE